MLRLPCDLIWVTFPKIYYIRHIRDIFQLCVTLSGSPLVQVVGRRSTHPSALFYVPECAHGSPMLPIRASANISGPASLSQPLLGDAELQEGGIAKPRWHCCAVSAVLQMSEGGGILRASTLKTVS